MTDQAPEAVPPAPATPTTWKDDDLVYVDPEMSTVIGKVEFGKNGIAKKLEMPDRVDPEDAKEGKPRKNRSKRYYPWGTYRSMKKVYKLEGKVPKVEPTHTLEQVIEKALVEPFWE